MNQVKFWFIKHTRFEFWPYGFAYIPVYFYYLYLSLRSKSLTFFTAANPGIFLGGFVGESKHSILQKINPCYLPATIYCKNEYSLQQIVSMLASHQMFFPLIAKPDIGERGSKVDKLNNEAELENYIHEIGEDFIIQSCVEDEIELGIMYYHFPNGTQSGITSIVRKDFLKITGDGIHQLDYLIKNNLRAQGRLDYLLDKFSDRLHEVLAKNETLLLEPIGNHSRGTKFINGNDLINEKLVKVFDEIAKPIEGFYIGRFDLKVTSLADLYEGKNIKILELNGAKSEPAHIYDPSVFIVKAYQALFNQYRLMYTIAQQNRNLGIEYDSFWLVLKHLKIHFRK